MPVLRDASGIIPDDWVRIETVAEAADGMRMILPWVEGFAPPPVPAHMLGVHLPNTTDPLAVRPHFPRLGLISVAFPSFTDGRGFSLARRLRTEGFRGRLRAAGPVIADQFAHLLACGFDEVETPGKLDARQPQPQWEAALQAVRLGYQQGYPGRENILEARRRARTGA